MNANKLQPLVLRPEEATTYNFPTGETVMLVLTSKDTGGAFTLLEGVFPQGAGAPLHVHNREDELIYVLEGTLAIQIKETHFTVGSGESAFLPRDIPHAFCNLEKQPVRALALITPGGYEAYFTDVFQLFADGESTLTAVTALSKKYGVANVEQPQS